MSPIECRHALTMSERAAHHAIRHQVFVEEQAIFAGSDLDERDRDEAVIRLMGYWNGIAAGTVRLFELDPAIGLWQGDRLAVLASYRTRGLGAPLVRCAVATAGAHGGRTMLAHVQPAHVTFFCRLGWGAVGEIERYAGLPHQRMSISLPTPGAGSLAVQRLSAGISARDR